MPSIFRRSWTLLLILFLATACSLLAADVPFSSELVIEDNFDRSFSVQAADIDGDGDLDVVGAARDGDPKSDVAVSWWENTNGDASVFVEHEVEIASVGATWVDAADMDADGDLDLLVATLFTDDVLIYENTAGDGSVWSITTIDGDFDGASAVVAVDMDGDGDLDVLGAAANANDISWWEESGGSWTEHSIDTNFLGARSVIAVDIDMDGDIDVAAAGEFADEVAWWQNTDGSATTWSKATVSTLPFDGAAAVTAGDLDGDGDTDLAGTAEANDDVTWWQNTAGDGSAWSETLIKDDFNGGHGMVARDVDADGDVDLLAAARNSDEIMWFENTAGDASAWTERLVDDGFLGGRAVNVGDLDSDGQIDLLAAGSDNDDIGWYDNESIHRNASFVREGQADTLLDGARDLAAADFDGDGDIDLAATADQDNLVVWYENTGGDPATWTRSNVATAIGGAFGIATADLDGDGDIDILATAEADNDVLWFENTNTLGLAWVEHTIDSDLSLARGVHATDVDQDGDLDVVAAGFGGERLVLYLNDDSGSTWTESNIQTKFDGAHAVHAADIDGDGDMDVVGAAETADDATWFENTAGDGSAWSAHSLDGSYDGANDVYAIDIDGDGDTDVLAVAELDDDVTWFENNGAEVFTERTIEVFFNGARAATPADFDGDGDVDLVAAQSKDGGRISWFENTGAATNWPQHDLTTAFDGATAVVVADFDNDGRIDVAAAADLDDDVSVFLNGGGQFGLATTDTSPASLGNSVTASFFTIVASHNGLAGEPDVELTSFELLLEETPGDPLNSAEANSILENLVVYLDDAGGADPGNWDLADTVVTTDPVFFLDGGLHIVAFDDGDADVAIAVGVTRTYFVIFETTADYSGQGLESFRVTHLTESSSTAEDSSRDTPLRLEWAANTVTNLFSVNPTPGSADLSISIVDDSEPVAAGRGVAYTVTVDNLGPGIANDVVVNAAIPAGSSFIASSGCDEDPTGAPVCNLGSIPSGGQAVFSVSVSVPPSAAPGSLSYTATVSSSTNDPVGGNNTDNETTAIVQVADLEISQRLRPRAYFQNRPQQYIVTVSNSGPSDALGSSATDTFPGLASGVTWTCSGTGGGTCSASGSGNFNETIDLPVGASVTFVAEGNVPATTAPLTNTATCDVGGTVSDPDSANNTTTFTSTWQDPIFWSDFEDGDTSEWVTVVSP